VLIKESAVTKEEHRDIKTREGSRSQSWRSTSSGNRVKYRIHMEPFHSLKFAFLPRSSPAMY